MHGNGFAKVFKNLVTDLNFKFRYKFRYRFENNFVGLSNNYAERSNITNNIAKNFDILATNLKVLHNYI